MSRLLPGNATPLERHAASALACFEKTPVPLRDLYDPERCPEHLLPFLAWAFSVDRWEPGWPVTVKRQVIRASWYVHAHKGTIGALRRVMEPQGYLVRVTEWWQENPPATPGTFKLEVGVLDSGITDEMHGALELLIADAKPVSRHLVGLAMSLEARGTAHIGVAALDGEALTVYPYAPGPIEVRSPIPLVGGAIHAIDYLSVYP